MTMNWAAGRVLQSISKGNNTYQYSYGIDGLRTKKNINGTKTYYYYDSNRNLVGMKKGDDTVLYYYDTDGSVVSMSVGEDTYFFIRNLQGDITKIIDSDRNTVATYTYDAWGKILTESEDSSVEGLNPFRYRGYVYDNETELYYLQSRYYDPKTGRFINADDSDYTDTDSGSPLSTNMFAYCENNAVNLVDYFGEDAALLFKKDSPPFVGHAAMIVQFHGGWYYFSVANSERNIFDKKFGRMKIAYAFLNAQINSKFTVKQINDRIDKQKPEGGSGYTSVFYFKGNFEASFWYFWGIKCKPQNYNLLNNNCLHVAT